jgi:hypothetical protein
MLPSFMETKVDELVKSPWQRRFCKKPKIPATAGQARRANSVSRGVSRHGGTEIGVFTKSSNLASNSMSEQELQRKFADFKEMGMPHYLPFQAGRRFSKKA